MTNLNGAVQILKKEHDRLAIQMKAISAALAAFGAAYTKKTGTRGRTARAMGEAESSKRPRRQSSDDVKTNHVGCRAQKDRSRPTRSMGESKSCPETGLARRLCPKVKKENK